MKHGVGDGMKFFEKRGKKGFCQPPHLQNGLKIISSIPEEKKKKHILGIFSLSFFLMLFPPRKKNLGLGGFFIANKQCFSLGV